MVWLAKSSVILLMGVGGGARKKMLDFVVMHEKERCVPPYAAMLYSVCPWG